MTLPSIGDVVDDKFRIERKLGEGGTSTIYEVRHLITEKKFAIKWLAPELAQNDLAVQLLFHEAKVSGRFVHPNAVQIYDICRTDDSYYLLMEFLEGETLETRLHRETRLSVREACDILLPCIEALSAAHRAGIVHRDLKPSNIFLCRVEGQAGEVPKVLDFGISNYVHGGLDISPTGSGTPLYMAPEQMWSQPADPKFDIYALGVVMYELVSGKPPFDSDDFDDLVNLIVEARATRLDEIVDIDPAFADIVARAMARGSDQRFATMAELAAALRPYGSREAQVDRAPVSEAPAKPAEIRESDTPSTPPRRSSWTSTTLGFVLQHHPALAARDAERSEPVLELADVAGSILPPEPEPQPEPQPEPEPERESESEPSLAALSQSLDGEPPSEPKLAPAGTFAAAPDATEEIELPEPEPAPVRPASQPPKAASKPPAAPPIALPPPRAAAVHASEPTNWAEEGFDGKTPWAVDELPAALVRARNQRRFGLIAAFSGAALITCYALVRALEPGSVTELSPARAVAPSAESSTVNVAPAHEPVPVPVAPIEPSQPTVAGARELAAADLGEADSERRAQRQRATKRTSSASANAKEERTTPTRSSKEASSRKTSRSEADSKELAIPSRRQAAAAERQLQREQRETSAANDSPKEFSIPSTGLSRGDF